jgi:hypothetical protein
MYKQVKDPITGEFAPCTIRLPDGAVIPHDPDNSDYQYFLAWCEAGNQPLPPDEELKEKPSV